MGDSGSEGLSGRGGNFGAEHLGKRNSPGSSSSGEIRKAVEQCLLSSASTLDVSSKNIKHLTEEIYRQPSIKYFHLERNVISTIPEDLFQKLPHLVWLDLRYNKIKALPPGIGYHRQLKTLLLEKNPIKELPAELGYRQFAKAPDLSIPAHQGRVDNNQIVQSTGDALLAGLTQRRSWMSSLDRFLHKTNSNNYTTAQLVSVHGFSSGCTFVTRSHNYTYSTAGNLTSLTALNLRHCPLEFPPKDVVQKGLKSILCFLRDSGNGKLLCMELATPGFREPPETVVSTEPSLCVSHDPSTAVEETPPVEKLNLSELVPRSLDLSEEWPNEEEKLRFERLRGELLKAEEAELAGQRGGAARGGSGGDAARGAAQRQASPAAQVTAARTARQEELLEDANHLNTGHRLHWQACV